MTTLSRLVDVAAPRDPEAVVLVLHGGASRGDRVVVSPTQLSVLRMVPTAHRIARAGRGRLAVLRLLNSYRGWQEGHTPLVDLGWALERVAERFPGRPVGLVGHSLGGGAALGGARADVVRSAVALNPWLNRHQPAVPTTARVLVVHGDRDRIASLEYAQDYVRRLAAGGATAGCVVVPGGKHAMLRHGGVFDGLAAAFTAAVLLGDPPPDGPDSALARVLSGDTFVTAG